MAYNTIRLKGSPLRDEAVANEEIYPGHLVELLSTGKVQKHDNSGGRCEKAFAFEDELQGKEISQAYAADAIVQYDIYSPGEEVLARVTGSPSVGAKLCSAGDGTLRECVSDSSALHEAGDYMVGVLMEAVSGGLGRVRIA